MKATCFVPVLRKARVGDLCVIFYGNPRVQGGTGEKPRASGYHGPESRDKRSGLVLSQDVEKQDAGIQNSSKLMLANQKERHLLT